MKKKHQQKRAVADIVPPSPAELIANLEKAMATGQWLVVICRVEGGKVHLERTANRFPVSDIDTAMQLIVQDAQQLKGK